jgi:hypothetical protein
MLLTLKKVCKNGNINNGGWFLSVKESGKKREKYSDINSFYYFNEVFDFNWLGVRMICWVRVHLRISQQ